MALTIENVNLQAIYSLSPEEKLDLVDLIIKSMKSAVSKVKTVSTENRASWVDQFEGKWEDSKSAEEMIADIRNSRIEGITLENWVR